MEVLRLKHLVATRWFHWLNFPLLSIMIWSGILIYWAFPTYSIGPLHFFPDWFYKAFRIPQRLADGMAVHFVFAWLFVINGVLYIAYTTVSGEWRLLVPQSTACFGEAWGVVLHDLHLRKDLPSQAKYNAAQQIVYGSCIDGRCGW